MKLKIFLILKDEFIIFYISMYFIYFLISKINLKYFIFMTNFDKTYNVCFKNTEFKFDISFYTSHIRIGLWLKLELYIVE